MRISGCRVLLTGAGGGLGPPIARRLHGAGAHLVLSGRDAESLEDLARELSADVIAADLADSEQTLALAHQAGAVDILIANAALPGAARLDRLTVAEAERVIDVNLRAPVLLAQALMEGMQTRGRGHLVFISSIGGLAAAPGNPLYHATKFGLRGLSAALRIDLHGSGVSASCILPGFISEAGLFAESGASLPPGVGTRSPQDVADAVLRAIERDLPEVKVAPLSLRAGTVLWSVAPDTAAAVSRRLGSEQIADTFEAALEQKR